MSPEVLTFGCRLNAHESEVIGRLAAGLGRAAVVNTCAVTAEAESQARQAIRRLHRADPARPIHVTGCAAQVAPAAWLALPGVVRQVPNAAKLDPAQWAAPGAPPGPAPAPARTRALIRVQDGCDHRCTFCIIPAGRGASRSVAAEAVVAEARGRVAAGAAEVVLTGVDIASWGADLPGRPRLGELVRAVLAAVPDLPRLRLSTLDPAALDGALWRALAEEPRLMPHLHLSLQAGAGLVLKRMRRRHGRADILALAARARALRPDVALGADLIAGFPTETEADHAETLALVAEAGLTWLHVFPYSERPGTPAARMPAVPVPVRRRRAAALRAAGAAAARAFLAGRVGAVEAVLAEAGGRGHTAHFAPVLFRGTVPPAGALVAARAIDVADDALMVEVLDGWR